MFSIEGNNYFGQIFTQIHFSDVQINMNFFQGLIKATSDESSEMEGYE